MFVIVLPAHHRVTLWALQKLTVRIGASIIVSVLIRIIAHGSCVFRGGEVPAKVPPPFVVSYVFKMFLPVLPKLRSSKFGLNTISWNFAICVRPSLQRLWGIMVARERKGCGNRSAL